MQDFSPPYMKEKNKLSDTVKEDSWEIQSILQRNWSSSLKQAREPF